MSHRGLFNTNQRLSPSPITLSPSSLTSVTSPRLHPLRLCRFAIFQYKLTFFRRYSYDAARLSPHSHMPLYKGLRQADTMPPPPRSGTSSTLFAHSPHAILEACGGRSMPPPSCVQSIACSGASSRPSPHSPNMSTRHPECWKEVARGAKVAPQAAGDSSGKGGRQWSHCVWPRDDTLSRQTCRGPRPSLAPAPPHTAPDEP